MFRGYWNNDTATGEALTDGWFHTGDIGELDDAGYLTITGRKKELIVTAGGKNVAPAVLEDRLRAHPLVSQCMVVGDGKPFIAALVTIDAEALPGWLERSGKPADTPLADLVDDPDLRAAIGEAVADANLAVSRAEQIREFRILAVDFTEAGGEMTPTMKVKRIGRRGEVRARTSRASTRAESSPPDPHRAHAGTACAHTHAGPVCRAEQRRQPGGPVGPFPVPLHPGAALGAHRRCAVRVGEQVDERVDEPAKVAPFDDVAGAPAAHGLRRAAGAARHHRQARGSRLQQRDTEPFDVQAACAGAARQGEDVTRRVVGGQVGVGNGAREHHRVGDVVGNGQRA